MIDHAANVSAEPAFRTVHVHYIAKIIASANNCAFRYTGLCTIYLVVASVVAIISVVVNVVAIVMVAKYFQNEKHDDKSGISSGAATASDAAVVVVALLLGLC